MDPVKSQNKTFEQPKSEQVLKEEPCYKALKRFVEQLEAKKQRDDYLTERYLKMGIGR